MIKVIWNGQDVSHLQPDINDASPVQFISAHLNEKKAIEEQGRNAWIWLHARCKDGALTKERLEREFIPMVPRYGCGCVREASNYIQSHALPVNPDEHEQWGIDFHNFINVKLGKPEWRA